MGWTEDGPIEVSSSQDDVEEEKIGELRTDVYHSEREPAPFTQSKISDGNGSQNMEAVGRLFRNALYRRLLIW